MLHLLYERAFESAPRMKGACHDENGLRLFLKEGLNDYIMRLFPLFISILHTKVEQDFLKVLPPKICYEKIAKFLVAVIARGLRQGGCVGRYLKDVPYLPYFVKKLLKAKGGRLLLANSDFESLDFKLALLSSIRFSSERQSYLFERKARRWAEKSEMQKSLTFGCNP